MGQMPAEQTVAIIEAVSKNEPNFWHLLWLAVIPVVLGWWLNRRK